MKGMVLKLLSEPKGEGFKKRIIQNDDTWFQVTPPTLSMLSPMKVRFVNIIPFSFKARMQLLFSKLHLNNILILWLTGLSEEPVQQEKETAGSGGGGTWEVVVGGGRRKKQQRRKGLQKKVVDRSIIFKMYFRSSIC